MNELDTLSVLNGESNNVTTTSKMRTLNNEQKELVYLRNSNAVCSSLDVAKKFGKRHDKLISEIERMYGDLIGVGYVQNGGAKFYFKSTYENRGKQYPMYLMNRDGFSLLVIGFTGKKALEWKLKYISAFNTMEAILSERRTTQGQSAIADNKENRLAETNEIKKFVEYAKQSGSKNAEKYYMNYSRLANDSVGITDRRLATIKQLNNLTFIENIILNQIRIGMEQEMYYKDIFKSCKAQIERFKEIAYLNGGAANG